MTWGDTILEIARYYALAGCVLAVVFLTVGVGRMDPGARGSYLFRLVVLPGVVVLWPVVATRWALWERRAAAAGRVGR